jgi:SagB-type dehydrogenase family enzyme
MTPSGGARNPYEAYVYATNVESLEYGLYHYSAIDNTLGLMTTTPAVTATQLLVGQYCADEAGAVILLVANFERTMWKYPNPTAYRVMLIEAGHIAQNISLAAANHHLSTTPTAAISDSAGHAMLGVDWIKQALVLAVLVGKATPDAFEVKNFIPNDRL